MATNTNRTRSKTPRTVTGDNLRPVLTIGSTEDESDFYPVKLCGLIYKVRPPKGSLAMRVQSISASLATMKDAPVEEQVQLNTELEGVFDKAVRSMFGDEYDSIQERLLDPQDTLDYEDLFSLMEGLLGLASKNPTS